MNKQFQSSTQIEYLELVRLSLIATQGVISTLVDEVSHEIIRDKATFALDSIIEDVECALDSLKSQRQSDLEKGVMYK